MTTAPRPCFRARIHLGSCRHWEAHPPSALTWPPRLVPDSHARPAPLDSRCFRVCAERRGGAPVRAAPSVPASRPSGSPRFLPTTVLRRQSPVSGQNPSGPLSSGTPTLLPAMAEPGEQLPEEVLALIFRHLPLRDRAAAARVCRAWAAAATCSTVWHNTNIREPSRLAAIELLTALAGRNPELRGLCLECRGEKRLFDSGRDVLDAVHALCRAARALRHLDLRRLPFTLDDALVLQVAHGCPELCSLFLDNSTLVGSVGPGSVLELLEACPCLRALGLHLASLSRTALEALAAPDRAPFELLALRCACPEDARASPLPNEAWAELSRRHPGLAVELELEPALPAESVTRVLQPAVPVAALRLSLSGDTVGPVRFAARHYAATLRALEVRAAASAELDAALEELAERCVGLREVHCFCVVRPSVLHAFRTHCPRLRSYTLKLTREPHPWRPTLVA
ncbi:F-box/LRR-repeat protein 8 isoform X2 [Lagenorhynchus albirostris]|nr:F-box/LRR-repeat protein 8 isoform X2 [Lagenorhynchus albirostris]